MRATDLAALVALCAACSTSADLGGVWRATAPPQSADNPLLYQAPGDPVGVELVLGQYGADVAGVMRWYHRGPLGDFDHARLAGVPDNECECVHLQQGKADTASGALSFVLQGCLPGSAPNTAVRVRGGMKLGEDGRLDGTLTVDQPGSPLNGKQVALVFERRATRLEATDLQCEQPVDASHGNTLSGL